ncbi:MAG: DNA polymerase [Raoultibacter sp.]
METERAVSKALEAYPLPESEWELYALDQRINDRGVRVDRLLVKNAMAVDRVFSAQAFLRAKELTGLENPGSVSQLKAWLSDQDMPMESLAKKVVQETAKSAEGIVKELLDLRLDLSKTSIKKYEAMARCVCRDGRVHGMLQFYGANRTGRWSGRNIQLQNLPQNHLPDLSLARDIVKAGDTELIETLFGSVPSTLSELIRTAFIPKDGCRFIVADFSAIEARVLAWLAGEEWVLEEFRGRGKIYEATASRMFSIPAETIVKGNPNYEYRQKGKQATLSCGFGGGVGALIKMGAKMPEEEMQPLVTAWRTANPHIVAFWGAMERAARNVIRDKSSARVGKTALYWKDDKMFMRLPSGRNLCYQSPHFTTNRFGNDAIGYFAPNAAGQMAEQETFGGKLVENLTQATARDLLAYGMTQLEAEGYPIIFHVHDECVLEMPIGKGSVEEACEIMARAPTWAEGLPIRADGDEMAFYQKS